MMRQPTAVRSDSAALRMRDTAALSRRLPLHPEPKEANYRLLDKLGLVWPIHGEVFGYLFLLLFVTTTKIQSADNVASGEFKRIEGERILSVMERQVVHNRSSIYVRTSGRVICLSLVFDNEEDFRNGKAYVTLGTPLADYNRRIQKQEARELSAMIEEFVKVPWKGTANLSRESLVRIADRVFDKGTTKELILALDFFSEEHWKYYEFLLVGRVLKRQSE